MGPVTSQLRKIYDDLVRGRLPAYAHWVEPVYEREAVAVN
jgi:hypothetical protein